MELRGFIKLSEALPFVLTVVLFGFQKGPPRFSEESILQLEKELVQARLKEAESQCALKEMQDKILDMEKVRCFFTRANRTGFPCSTFFHFSRGTPHYQMTLMWHDSKTS